MGTGFEGPKTVIYGHEETVDGHIVTEWFTFLFMPILPLNSYLIPKKLPFEYPLPINTKPTDQWIKLKRLHLAHLLRGWSITIGIFLLLFITPYILDYFN